MLQVSIDDRVFHDNIKKLERLAPVAAHKSLLDIGYELLRLSQEQVPHDKGTLQDSGNVEEVLGDVLVGYHTPYAARLHEHPEYNFQKGRKGKYLTDPLEKNEEVFKTRISEDLDLAIKGVLHG